MEALAGLVERVTFHNADTGFRLLRVKALIAFVPAITLTLPRWLGVS